MSAVSMKLPPAWTNASMIANDAASSAVQPNCMVPRHSSETFRSLRPSLRRCMQIQENGWRAGCEPEIRPHPRGAEPKIAGFRQTGRQSWLMSSSYQVTIDEYRQYRRDG